jgi:serine/threonine protein kinase
MYSIGIIHGDIKPENVLVFKEKSGQYSAKVIDFGYSARYTDHSHQLMLVGSELWNAPEHSNHGPWSLSQAIKADLFSLGMLFLWLLFEPCSPRRAMSSSPEVTDISPSRMEDNLGRRKRKLRAYAQELLAMTTTLEGKKKEAFRKFFDSSLNETPEQRHMESLQELLRKLDPQR